MEPNIVEIIRNSLRDALEVPGTTAAEARQETEELLFFHFANRFNFSAPFTEAQSSRVNEEVRRSFALYDAQRSVARPARGGRVPRSAVPGTVGYTGTFFVHSTPAANPNDPDVVPSSASPTPAPLEETASRRFGINSYLSGPASASVASREPDARVSRRLDMSVMAPDSDSNAGGARVQPDEWSRHDEDHIPLHQPSQEHPQPPASGRHRDDEVEDIQMVVQVPGVDVEERDSKDCLYYSENERYGKGFHPFEPPPFVWFQARFAFAPNFSEQANMYSLISRLLHDYCIDCMSWAKMLDFMCGTGAAMRNRVLNKCRYYMWYMLPAQRCRFHPDLPVNGFGQLKPFDICDDGHDASCWPDTPESEHAATRAAALDFARDLRTATQVLESARVCVAKLRSISSREKLIPGFTSQESWTFPPLLDTPGVLEENVHVIMPPPGGNKTDPGSIAPLLENYCTAIHHIIKRLAFAATGYDCFEPRRNMVGCLLSTPATFSANGTTITSYHFHDTTQSLPYDSLIGAINLAIEIRKLIANTATMRCGAYPLMVNPVVSSGEPQAPVALTAEWGHFTYPCLYR